MPHGVPLSLHDLFRSITGPESAIKHQTKIWIRIIPGKMKISDAAKRLRTQVAAQVSTELQSQLLAINIDEIIAVLPPGPVELLNEP